MKPERLDQWINKVVPGGRSLVLLHDQAIGPALVIGCWSREECDDAQQHGLSIGDQLLDAAQDHSDNTGEACRFQLQWQNESGRPLRTMIHKSFPRDVPKQEGAIVADAVSSNAMVGQLLGHISTQQKVINGSIGAVLAAYERAMAMQAQMLKQQGEMLTQRSLELQALIEQGGGDQQLADIKKQAWTKVVELGPDVVRLALERFAGTSVTDEQLAEATRVMAANSNGSGQGQGLAS